MKRSCCDTNVPLPHRQECANGWSAPVGLAATAATGLAMGGSCPDDEELERLRDAFASAPPGVVLELAGAPEVLIRDQWQATGNSVLDSSGIVVAMTSSPELARDIVQGLQLLASARYTLDV